MKKREDYSPKYKVFKEYFVLCWAGQKKEVKDKIFYSRVDIELINEQRRLFYSALDEVSIANSENNFSIIEYVKLGLHNNHRYYKLEETVIEFGHNGNYSIDTNLLFEPPQFDKKVLHHIYNSNNALIEKLKKEMPLNINEINDLKNLSATYLICYLNGFENAIDKLEEVKPLLKSYSKEIYKGYKLSMRILRKVRYN